MKPYSQDLPVRAKYQGQARQRVLEGLKFIDESGVNLALTRSHGRAAPGERVVEAVPQNYGSNVTLLAAPSLNGVSAPGYWKDRSIPKPFASILTSCWARRHCGDG
jgi:hypothetical protein